MPISRSSSTLVVGEIQPIDENKIEIIADIAEELYRSEYNYEVTMLYAGKDGIKWKELDGCDSWTIINPIINGPVKHLVVFCWSGNSQGI